MCLTGTSFRFRFNAQRETCWVQATDYLKVYQVLLQMSFAGGLMAGLNHGLKGISLCQRFNPKETCWLSLSQTLIYQVASVTSPYTNHYR